MNNLLGNRIFKIFIPLIDLIIIYASILLTFYILRSTLVAFIDNYYAFLSISPFIGISYLIISHILELDRPKDFSFFGVAYTVTLTVFILLCTTMAISFLAREFAYPRSILILSSVIQIIFLSIWHLFSNKVYYKVNSEKSILIVGYSKTKELAYKMLVDNGMWSNIKYISTPEDPKLYEYIDTCEITFITDDVNEIKKQEIVKYCVERKKSLLYEPSNSEILLFNGTIRKADDVLLLDVKHLGIQPGSEAIKRGFDMLLGIIGAIVFIIPIAITYLCLKIGGGSAFFVQERVTRDGRIFKIYKFRTMIENAESKSGPMLAQDSDKRITKLGNILRTTRLDEMPQIFNILKGDMSIVGPRPERPFFVEQYKKEIPEYDLRHRVKAGLTGLAQIQGKYNSTAKEKLKYDLLYINGYSLLLDIKLVIQTLNILLRKSSTEGVKSHLDIETELDRLFKQNEND